MKFTIALIFLVAIILSGCNENNFYSGIEKNDISDISDTENLEFVYEYKGHSDNWAANYIVYKVNGNDNHITRLLLKYIGKKPRPTGELSYSFETGSASGHGLLPDVESIEGVYDLGTSGGIGATEDKDSIINMNIDWNGNTDKFELKFEMKVDR